MHLINKMMNEINCLICRKYRKFEKPKISYHLEKKHQFFVSFAVTPRMNMKNYLRKEN